jgi:hypothetical protein
MKRVLLAACSIALSQPGITTTRVGGAETQVEGAAVQPFHLAYIAAETAIRSMRDSDVRATVESLEKVADDLVPFCSNIGMLKPTLKHLQQDGTFDIAQTVLGVNNFVRELFNASCTAKKENCDALYAGRFGFSPATAQYKSRF